MVKRVLSLALAAVLMFSLITTSYATEDKKAELDYKFDVLQSLGIINGDSFSEYALYRDLSKNSFINYVCNLYGGYGYSSEHSDDAIALAEGLGLIHGGQDDLYKPLPFEEAITILIRLMGYGMHAEENGGFPTGYTSIAKRLGLMDGLDPSNGRAMQEHDAITLLYNTINCAYVDIHSFTDDGIVYGGASDKTVLYELRKIYRVKGVLKSSGNAVLTSDIQENSGTVKIDEYEYDTDGDFSDYLGLYVEAYVKEANNYDEVLFMTPIDNKELIVQAGDIIGISDEFNTFEYFSADNKKKVSVSSVAAVVYNGQPLDSYTVGDFKPAEGSIRFVENDNTKSGYDVVFITDYKTVIVETVSKVNETVKNLYTYDETNLLLDLQNKNEDIIKIYDGEKEISVRDIVQEAVLTVKESTVGEKHVVTVYVSNKKIGGTVSHMKQNEDIVVTVDGVEYVLSEAYEEALSSKDSMAVEIKTGQNYNFYIDSMGKIAYAKEMAGVMRYGIVMNTTVEGAFGNEYLIRLFTTEGEWKTFKFADKVDYNGDKQTMSQKVLDGIETAHNGKISVVAYTTNSEGNIISLDLPKAYDGLDDNTFNYKMNMTNNYRPNNTSFQSQMFIDSNAVMWFVKVSESANDAPERRLQLLKDEDSYSARSTAALAQDKSYTFHAFNIDRFCFADIFIIEETNQLALDSMAEGNIFVVDEVSETLSSDGEIMGTVSGMMGSYDAISYYCEEPSMVMGLKRGDVITLHTNSKGYIDNIQKIYDISMGVDYYCPTETEIHSINTKLNGIVKLNSVSNNRMKVDCGSGEWNMRTASNNLVVVYDTVTDTLRRGGIADIEPGDFIVTRLNRSRISTIVVYK